MQSSPILLHGIRELRARQLDEVTEDLAHAINDSNEKTMAIYREWLEATGRHLQ